MATQRTHTLADELADMRALRAAGKCPICRKPGPFEFKDALSRKEYGISGLCQPCQDAIFSDADTMAEVCWKK